MFFFVKKNLIKNEIINLVDVELSLKSDFSILLTFTALLRNKGVLVKNIAMYKSKSERKVNKKKTLEEKVEDFLYLREDIINQIKCYKQITSNLSEKMQDIFNHTPVNDDDCTDIREHLQNVANDPNRLNLRSFAMFVFKQAEEIEQMFDIKSPGLDFYGQPSKVQHLNQAQLDVQNLLPPANQILPQPTLQNLQNPNFITAALGATLLRARQYKSLSS